MSSDHHLNLKKVDPGLYNEDLAPLKLKDRTWGSFEIFNVWANDVQSLFGYTLAASLFISSGLNGWAVWRPLFLPPLSLCICVIWPGSPVFDTVFPVRCWRGLAWGFVVLTSGAMTRGVVAMFWYGVQTYFAATAVTLLLSSLFRSPVQKPIWE